MIETASAWRANAKVFRETALGCNGHLRYGYKSIAETFTVNAKILEAYIKAEKPEVDKYHELFPEGQED